MFVKPDDGKPRAARMIQESAKWLWLCALLAGGLAAHAQALLPGTAPLAAGPAPAEAISAAIDNFLAGELRRTVGERPKLWRRDFSSPLAYEQSVRTNRERLRQMTGEEHGRAREGPAAIEVEPALLAQNEAYTVQAARWPVLTGVQGEGLWLRPKGAPLARVVAIPDAGQTPEMAAGIAPGLAPDQQFARRLAENGCEVLAMVLIDRRDAVAADPGSGRPVGQSRRETVYRRAFPLGTTIIGLEATKVMAAIDWLGAPQPGAHGRVKLGVAGYAEGGLIALYAAAMDPRIDAALVSGYFDSRQRLGEEPLDRNLFGLLREFGDAELASLIAPRGLIIEYSALPRSDGPASARPDAAAGTLSTPDYDSVETERERAQALLGHGGKALSPPTLICGTEGATCGPGSDRALTALLNALGVGIEDVKRPGPAPTPAGHPADAALRQQRQFQELLGFTEDLRRQAGPARDQFFWALATAASPEEWEPQRARFKRLLWEDTLGRLAAAAGPLNPRSRLLDLPSGAGQARLRHWTAYEVRIDVSPEVLAGGYLLMPQDLKEGERRPAVVCQRAMDADTRRVRKEDPQAAAVELPDGPAARLADRGFVVFVMQTPEWSLARERKASPLGLSLSSFMVAQNGRVLEWLTTMPFVDPGRIGFYGLSVNPAAVLTVPAILDGYSVAVCSIPAGAQAGDDAPAGTGVPPPSDDGSQIPAFGLEPRFGLAEFAGLMAPRPVMLDCARAGRTTAETVAAACAKAGRFYEQLGVGARAAINPPGNGSDTNATDGLSFLEQHLRRPGQ